MSILNPMPMIGVYLRSSSYYYLYNIGTSILFLQKKRTDNNASVIIIIITVGEFNEFTYSWCFFDLICCALCRTETIEPQSQFTFRLFFLLILFVDSFFVLVVKFQVFDSYLFFLILFIRIYLHIVMF